MQGDVAEWTPFAAVEGYEERPLRKQFVARDFFTNSIRELKLGELSSDFDNSICMNRSLVLVRGRG
jgi:hypothetical protein